MFKKMMLMLNLLLLCSVVFADRCPSVKEIKLNQLKNWKAYDSEKGNLLEAKRFAQFQQHVEAFTLAEWFNHTKKNGMIRCYYRDKNGANLYVFLAKERFIPNNTKNYWYEVSGFTQCAAGVTRCLFNPMFTQSNYLAKK